MSVIVHCFVSWDFYGASRVDSIAILKILHYQWPDTIQWISKMAKEIGLLVPHAYLPSLGYALSF